MRSKLEKVLKSGAAVIEPVLYVTPANEDTKENMKTLRKEVKDTYKHYDTNISLNYSYKLSKQGTPINNILVLKDGTKSPEFWFDNKLIWLITLLTFLIGFPVPGNTEGDLVKILSPLTNMDISGALVLIYNWNSYKIDLIKKVKIQNTKQLSTLV